MYILVYKINDEYFYRYFYSIYDMYFVTINLPYTFYCKKLTKCTVLGTIFVQ